VNQSLWLRIKMIKEYVLNWVDDARRVGV